jgi:hypothetical protein
MQLYTTLHECSVVQNLAQSCFLLLGVTCSEADDVYVMAGRNENSLDTSSFLTRIQIFLYNLV